MGLEEEWAGLTHPGCSSQATATLTAPARGHCRHLLKAPGGDLQLPPHLCRLEKQTIWEVVKRHIYLKKISLHMYT